jgi:hypothetical protein
VRGILAVLVVGLLLCVSSAGAQWSKEYVQVNQYRLNGQGIPGRGVTMGEYISGDLKVFAGSSENELVVKVGAFRAEGTYTNPEANKRDERAYLFCVFYKDDPTSRNSPDAKIKQLLISDCNQRQYEIDRNQQISIEVPDHASYVIFSLAQFHSSSAKRGGYNGYIPGQDFLIDQCGYGPSGGELARFVVKRPYRPEAVRSAEEYEGGTEDVTEEDGRLNGWDGPP